MKTTVIVSLVFALLFPVLAFAHSPSNIALSYDETQKLLHIQMVHVTVKNREHYIRRITVTKNNEKPVDYYYPAQTSANGMETDVEITAEPGDVVKIKAFCSEAGSGEASLTIPEKKPEQKK
jgi:hypothetical protein